MKIPFLDLKLVNDATKSEMTAAFNRVMESGWYIQGKELEAFESEFSDYCKTDFCIGVGTGLDALHLLLVAYGIGPGDEVLVPSNTFIATWLAVTRTGATPIATEPDPDTYNISVQSIEAAITPSTAAIIPVHLYGQPADMDTINAVAEKHKLIVIEDAAQSQGALYRNRPAGSLGHAAATSFYPGKNLGALGDGGAILTNDKAIAKKVRELRNYGSLIKYQHDSLGYNSRLDEMQAAFLRIKLKVLSRANENRRQIARRYTEGLSDSDVIVPFVPEWAIPAWHLYVIRSNQRDELQAHLKANGIETLVHYPIPPHQQKCYSNDMNRSLPIAERLSAEILSLPISPSMPMEHVDYVVEKIRAFKR
ncbi:DegT/DnrJ/EryC1/StrS family aminotransferase [Pseudomonas sp. BNK-45]|uniref:DegT/DnrJ/EryC1/StrS family aminotransferase n=1 Tax=Pseudomonas sp. BNK-45 TaxID=3376180 RepID=UPI0039BFAA2A